MTSRSDVAAEPAWPTEDEPAIDEAAERLPSLSIVMPVFNEERWIEPSVEAVVAAAANAGWPVEIVVVDDGSTDSTPRRLEVLAQRYGVRVVTQDNRGRFAARHAGLLHATGEQVLLVDSRVLVEPDALRYLREQLLAHPERNVWNGHVNVVSDGNPYAGFWAGLVAVAWRRYLAQPRLMSFGADDFDAFPKGTGFFCAPRDVLVDAAGSFSSLYDDVRLASDDTRMLRSIAQRGPIHIGPGLAARYHSRDSLPKFARHAYFRGTTFVDGYLDAPGPARRAGAVAAVVGLVGLVLAARRPRTAALLGLGACAGAGAVVRRCGGTGAQSRAVAMLLPLFVACFGAGVLRGLVLAAGKLLRR